MNLKSFGIGWTCKLAEASAADVPQKKSSIK